MQAQTNLKVSDKILEKMKRIISCFKSLLPKALPFIGYCEKLWYNTARGHRRQCNTAHARCVLGDEGYRHTHTYKHTINQSINQSHKLFNTTAFHGDNVCANAPQCHLLRIQLLCFSFSANFPFLSCVFAKSDNVTPSSMHAATLLCLLCSKQFSSFSPFFSFFRIDFLWS